MLNTDLYPQIEELMVNITPYLQKKILRKEYVIESVMSIVERKIRNTIASMLGITPENIYIFNNGLKTEIIILHSKVNIKQWYLKEFLFDENIYIVKNKVCAYTNKYAVRDITNRIQNRLNAVIAFFEKFHYEVYLYVKTYVYQTKEV